MAGRSNKIELDITSADGKYIESMATDKIGFKECCEQYSQIKPEPGTYSLVEDERLARLRNLCPEACEAVDKLGIEEVRRMKYHKQNIHRKLVSICTEPQADKIRKELSRRLKQFTPYTAPEVKKSWVRSTTMSVSNALPKQPNLRIG